VSADSQSGSLALRLVAGGFLAGGSAPDAPSNTVRGCIAQVSAGGDNWTITLDDPPPSSDRRVIVFGSEIGAGGPSGTAVIPTWGPISPSQFTIIPLTGAGVIDMTVDISFLVYAIPNA